MCCGTDEYLASFIINRFEYRRSNQPSSGRLFRYPATKHTSISSGTFFMASGIVRFPDNLIPVMLSSYEMANI